MLFCGPFKVCGLLQNERFQFHFVYRHFQFAFYNFNDESCLLESHISVFYCKIFWFQFHFVYRHLQFAFHKIINPVSQNFMFQCFTLDIFNSENNQLLLYGYVLIDMGYIISRENVTYHRSIITSDYPDIDEWTVPGQCSSPQAQLEAQGCVA